MFGRLRVELRQVDEEYMSDETRAELVEKYTREAESYHRLAELEESRLEALGSLRRRSWARVRLYLCRVSERSARGHVERLRSTR